MKIHSPPLLRQIFQESLKQLNIKRFNCIKHAVVTAALVSSVKTFSIELL